MKRVLVTGGLGYIGSHTVVALQQQGYEAVIVDNLSNSKASVLQGIQAITGQQPKWYNTDVCSTEELSKIVENEQIDAVIHFAAFKAVGESVEQPLKYFQNNIGGLNSLLAAMSDHKVNTLVFSSSCTVYGDTKVSPIAEDQARVKAISPYGTSKIISEEILEDVAKFTPLQVVSLRYFNPVGAHESAEIGELPLGIPNNLVPFITQTAAGIRKKLTIFGKDYNTPDGTNIRDFIHVMDLAIAHVKALEYSMANRFDYEVFNLGTGKGHSVLEVVQSFERVTNQKVNYIFGERRAGDVVQIWANPSKASRELKWKAERNLDEMMASAWKWQQKLQSSI